MVAVQFSMAEPADVSALNKLVNGAYRGEYARKGWTTEADLLDGVRTDESALIEMISKPGSAIMLARMTDHQLAGCVYLEKRLNSFYLGMLSVDPVLQTAGIGKQLLAHAEDYARNNGASVMVMTVISVRHELIAWYERYGYSKSGETRPFPADPAFGIPR